MRLIKNFEFDNLARKFSFFLKTQKIDNNIDVSFDENNKRFNYQIWIIDEDKITLANELLLQFEQSPNNPKYDIPEEPLPLTEKKRRRVSNTLTYFFLFVCIFVFVINLVQENKLKKKYPNQLFFTPVQSLLLFDLPNVLVKTNDLLLQYRIDPNHLENLPLDLQEKLKQLDQEPQWIGLYDLFFIKTGLSNKTAPPIAMFEKISQGQIWRFFTPTLLHLDLLHILFNMLWLIFLGKQIEQRISKFKYLVFIVVVGVISNTAQYLMSGPYFLGFSGVIMGMVAFIWVRQRIAPWEGYPTPKSVFLFIGVYIILMFILSFFSFVTQSLNVNIPTPSIANTGHLVGAICGFLFGRLSFFSWRPHHEC